MIDTATLALVLSSVSILISWRAWRLGKANAVLNRPYPEKRVYGAIGRVKLVGPNADDWEVSAVRLLWPPSARFTKLVLTFDDGGSVDDHRYEVLGRVIRQAPFTTSVSSPRRCRALISARSRTSWRYRAWWFARIEK